MDKAGLDMAPTLPIKGKDSEQLYSSWLKVLVLANNKVDHKVSR